MTNDKQPLSIKSFKAPISKKIPLSDDTFLILFVSYPTAGVTYQNVLSREICKFSNNGDLVWQIDPEPGHTDTISGRFIIEESYEAMFIDMALEGARLKAYRFEGDVFNVNLRTGLAEFDHWEKN